jgi:O-antigen/teichoic acid export membrane protein
MGLALWATPQLLDGLGAAQYALYSTLGTIVGYFAWLELGLGAAYVRDLTLSLGARDLHLAQRQLATAHWFYRRIAIVGCVLMLATGWVYIAILEQDRNLREAGFLAVLVMAAGFGATMSLSTSRAVVFASQRYDLYSKAALGLGPTIPVMQVLLLSAGAGMPAVLGVQATANVAVDLFMLWAARTLEPALRYEARFDQVLWDSWRGFSLARFGVQLATQAQLTADRVLLPLLLPLSSVAPYAIAGSVALKVRGLQDAVISPFYPAAIAALREGGRPSVEAVLARFGGAVMSLLALGLALTDSAAGPFLEAWIGVDMAREGRVVLFWLVAATVALTFTTLLTLSLDALGLPQRSAAVVGAGLAVSIGLAYPLTHGWGALGMSLAFVAGPVVSGVAALVLVVRALGRGPLTLTVALVLTPAVAGATATLAGHLVEGAARVNTLSIPPDLMRIVGCIAAGLLLAGIGFFGRPRPSHQPS